MTKICCKVTAISETVKSPLMGILARSPHQILGLKDFASIKATSEENKDSWRNNTEKMYFCALESTEK